MTVMIDIKETEVHRLADMHYQRLFHGTCLLDNYLYVTGGINDVGFVNFSERYCLKRNEWFKDVPCLPDCIFNHNMIAIGNKWIYSFGGLCYRHENMTVLRLNTQ